MARAFLKDAPILILDEPTSSIDSRTEATILDALDRLMVGRTTLIVAHRLSTLRRADHVFVFDGGELVEEGSHASLTACDGLYARLHAIQSGQSPDGAGGDPAPETPPDGAAGDGSRSAWTPPPPPSWSRRAERSAPGKR
jgi:ABC-type multidrug transport system ATPase subunit